MTMYRIYIRDQYRNKVGELTDFKQLQLIPRFNNVGSFLLDISTNSPGSRELIKQKSGIIVVKDGQSIFSGQVTSRKRSFNTSGDTMQFCGKDDNYYLLRNLAYPEMHGHFALQDYDVRTGPAETIMKQYVNDNIGTNADFPRKQITVEADTGIGDTVTGRARFDTLLDLLSSLAIQGGGLGFNVVQEGKDLVFKVYQPTDKTKSVFFSPLLGNISSFDYSDDDPEANLVIAGGGGIGANRLIDWKADNNSIVKCGRIETFVDKRDTTDTTELEKAVDEELTNKAEKVSLNFTPIDTPNLQFGKDYGLGDTVSIALTQPNETVELVELNYFLSFYQSGSEQIEKIKTIQEKFMVFQDIVREVNITIAPDAVSIQPTVGTTDSTSKIAFGLFDRMNKAFKRISNLERV